MVLETHMKLCVTEPDFLGKFLDFSGFCEGASNHYEVVHDNAIFLKNFFCPKNWGNGPKISFLNF